MKQCLLLIAAVAVCASSGLAVDWKALRPQGFVNDFAGVVDPRTKVELEAYCAQVEQATGVRISFVTLSSLEGEPLEDVARAIFHFGNELPGAPAPEKDQRVMLILTVNDRHDWVETGPALQPEITTGLAAQVLRETRLALRRRDYNEALRDAADVIGTTSARARKVTLHARIERRIHWSPSDAIPWAAVAGGLLMLIVLMWAGNPAGYGGLGGRGLLPGLVRHTMSRCTWGSHSGGGFGGFDSGDSSGGFGGGCCRDW
jgi:uncharacterized protein